MKYLLILTLSAVAAMLATVNSYAQEKIPTPLNWDHFERQKMIGDRSVSTSRLIRAGIPALRVHFHYVAKLKSMDDDTAIVETKAGEIKVAVNKQLLEKNTVAPEDFVVIVAYTVRKGEKSKLVLYEKILDPRMSNVDLDIISQK